MEQQPIYHMAHKADWARALAGDSYGGSADDLRDGFIHFSTAEQLAESAAKHRAGQTDLVLVAVDPSKLGDELKWEPGRRGEAFPHLYGTLSAEAVVGVEYLPLGPDGLHQFPPHIPPARAE